MSASAESEKTLTPAQVEMVLAGFESADWQRLKIISATLCAGIPDLTAADLLQEAMVKFLEGRRVWPGGVHPLVVLKNAMHSIASNARKREADGPIDSNIAIDQLEMDVDDKTVSSHGTLTVTPEDQLSGKQQLAALYAALGRHDAVRKRLLRRLAEFDPDRRKT